MNSEEISSNSSESEATDNRKNLKELFKKYRKFIIAICCCIVVVVGIVIMVNSNNEKKIQRLQEDYMSAVNSYNETVAKYNSEVDRIVSLRTYINQVSDANLPNNEVKKQDMIADFENFYNSGADFDLISQETNACIADVDNICDQYNQLALNNYNEQIELFNSEAEKYNSLLEKMAGYSINGMPNAVSMLDDANRDNSELMERWKNIQSYIDDVSSIDSQIDELKQNYYNVCLSSYNGVVGDFNIVAVEYNKVIKQTSIDFIDGMAKEVKEKPEMDTDTLLTMSEEELCDSMDSVLAETEILVGYYLIATQITNPSQQWVMNKLKKIDSITQMEAVTKDKDPNELLGKEGGYTACIYFTIKDINANSVKGNSVVEKGTDAGGAIEVYESLEYALNRCDYLSQFDGTVLYSGSYAIIGTMVIRTSYKLSNSQQIELTNLITKEFTTID